LLTQIDHMETEVITYQSPLHGWRMIIVFAIM